MLLRAHHRAKDVLYLMVRYFFFISGYYFLKKVYVFLNFILFLQARLYHILGVFEERNHVSAELKRLEDQYCTNGASQLAIML